MGDSLKGLKDAEIYFLYDEMNIWNLTRVELV